MIRSITLSFLLAVCFTSYSQQSLNLEDALAKAMANNKQLRIQILENDLANADIKKLHSAYLPHLNLNYQFYATNDPLNAFGFNLQQSGIQTSDFNPDLLNNPETRYHGNTKLTIQQALFHYDLIALKKGLKARLKATQYQQVHAENKIKLEVKNAFTDLQYLYAALEVSQRGLSAFTENERVIKNFMQQGLTKKSDLYAVQIELANIEFQISQLKRSIENLSSYISFLTGEFKSNIYIPSSALSLDSLQIFENSLADRPDFKAMQAAIESRNFTRTSELQGIIPKLNAFGEFNLYDKNVLGFGHPAYTAGIQLQWNLFNGNARSYSAKKQELEIEKANVEMSMAYDQAQLEILKTENDRKASQDNMMLSQKQVTLSEENKKLIHDRFQQGLEKTADVLNAELILMMKKLLVAEHTAKHNKTLHQLEFLKTQIKN